MPARKRYQPDPGGGGGSDDPLGVGDLPPYVPAGQEIGVPPGYTTQADISSYSDIFGGPSTVSRRPIYMEGDELLPANYGPDRIADLQKALADVGLLPEGTHFRYKVWDDTTQQAFRSLLAYANQNGLHWTTALNKLQASEAQGGGGYTIDEHGNLVPVGDQAQEPLPTHTTPREELEPVFRQAVIDTLGQGWDQGRIDSMVTAYQQEEVARQREAYAAEGTTRNVQEMPSPEAFIAAKAEASDPGRAQAEKGLKYVGMFDDIFGGWEGAGMGTL